MNYLNKIILLPLLIFGLFSCKFYYNSSDINKKLKTSLDNINSNCEKLSGQINNYQSEYLKLNCNNSTSEQKMALSMFEDINTSLNSMNSFKKITNDEYLKFLTYTKEKDKIQSGTPEWKNFKKTKRQFKTSLKSIQKIGNTTVKKAEDLNKLVSEQIAPKIQKCVIADYKKSIELAFDSLSKLQRELPMKINDYSNKVKVVLTRFNSSNPDKCKELNSELSKMSELNQDMSLIVKKVTVVSLDFISKTKGKEFVYSCSTDWGYIMNVEQELKNLQTDFQALKMKLELSQNTIQSILDLLNR